MKKIIFTLPHQAKFSFSTLPLGSDTLFAALANCAALLYGPQEAPKIIENFPSFSSLFLGVDILLKDKKTRLYFYPRPHMGFKINKEEKNNTFDPVKDRKKLKKVQFVSEGVFTSMLLDFNLEAWQKEQKNITHYSLMEKAQIAHNFAFQKEELPPNLENKVLEALLKQSFLSQYLETKNSLNRLSGASEEFFEEEGIELKHIELEEITLKPFFFCLAQTQEISTPLKACLNLLCEEGLGAYRTTGKGILEKVEIEQAPNFHSKVWVNLSLVFPKEEELSLENCIAYDLTKRGGFVFWQGGTTTRKPVLRYFKEGSVFLNPLQGIRLKETLPLFLKSGSQQEITLYINGKALMVGGKS